MDYECRFLNGDHNIIVFNSNHTSIVRRFRYNQGSPLAGKDGIVLFPQGGAAGEV